MLPTYYRLLEAFVTVYKYRSLAASPHAFISHL